MKKSIVNAVLVSRVAEDYELVNEDPIEEVFTIKDSGVITFALSYKAVDGTITVKNKRTKVGDGDAAKILKQLGNFALKYEAGEDAGLGTWTLTINYDDKSNYVVSGPMAEVINYGKTELNGYLVKRIPAGEKYKFFDVYAPMDKNHKLYLQKNKEVLTEEHLTAEEQYEQCLDAWKADPEKKETTDAVLKGFYDMLGNNVIMGIAKVYNIPGFPETVNPDRKNFDYDYAVTDKETYGKCCTYIFTSEAMVDKLQPACTLDLLPTNMLKETIVNSSIEGIVINPGLHDFFVSKEVVKELHAKHEASISGSSLVDWALAGVSDIEEQSGTEDSESKPKVDLEDPAIIAFTPVVWNFMTTRQLLETREELANNEDYKELLPKLDAVIEEQMAIPMVKYQIVQGNFEEVLEARTLKDLEEILTCQCIMGIIKRADLQYKEVEPRKRFKKISYSGFGASITSMFTLG